MSNRVLSIFFIGVVGFGAASGILLAQTLNTTGSSAGYVEGEILVRFKAGAASGERTRVFSKWSRSYRKDAKRDFYRTHIPMGRDFKEVLRGLKDDPAVQWAQPNYIYKISAFDPPTSLSDGYLTDGSLGCGPSVNANWPLVQIHAPQAWDALQNICLYGPVTVADIDTGVASDHDTTNHPDLPSSLFVPGFNSTSDHGGNPSNTIDNHGHGTWTTGIIAAQWHNATSGNTICTTGIVPPSFNGGLAGVAGHPGLVRIMPIKVLDSTGHGTSTDIAEGIDFARLNGAKVLNMSFGSSNEQPDDHLMEAAVEDAINAGCILVASSGNNQGTVLNHPAIYPGVIAVGATHSGGGVAFYSSAGPGMDLVAPGGMGTSPFDPTNDILGCMLNCPNPLVTTGNWYGMPFSNPCDNNYMTAAGTSASAPFVTGAVALLLAANPTLTNAQVTQILTSTATDMGNAGWDPDSGYGLLNLEAALTIGLQPCPQCPSIQFSDDFSNEQSLDNYIFIDEFMTPGLPSNFSCQVSNERLTVGEAGWSGTSLLALVKDPLFPSSQENYTLEADFKRNGPESGEFGIIFRADSTTGEAYFFVWDGTWKLQKSILNPQGLLEISSLEEREEGELPYLLETWTRLKVVINADDSFTCYMNRLDGQGDHLIFDKLVDINAPSGHYASGAVGFIGYALLTDQGLEVDNFKARSCVLYQPTLTPTPEDTPTPDLTLTPEDSPTPTDTPTPAGSPTPTPTCMPSFGDFYPNSSSLDDYSYYGDNWTASTASESGYQVIGQELTVGATDPVYTFALLNDNRFSHAYSNYVVEGDFKLDGSPSVFGLVFRADAASGQAYIFQWNGIENGGQWEIEKRTPSSNHIATVTSVPDYVTGTLVHLKVVVGPGNLFNAYADFNDEQGEQLVFSGVSDTLPTPPAYDSGAVGIRAYNMWGARTLHVDNFNVYGINGCIPVPSPTPTDTPTPTFTPTFTFTSTPTCIPSLVEVFMDGTSLNQFDFYGNTWAASTASASGYAVVNGGVKVAPSSGTVHTFALLKDQQYSHAFSNYTIEGDFKLDQSPAVFGLVFRANAAVKSAYIFQWNGMNGRWEIERKKDPSFSPGYDYPAYGNPIPTYAAGTWVHLKVVVGPGNLFNAYADLNDGQGLRPVFNGVSDNSANPVPFTSGAVGIRAYEATSTKVIRVDNFNVYGSNGCDPAPCAVFKVANGQVGIQAENYNLKTTSPDGHWWSRSQGPAGVSGEGLKAMPDIGTVISHTNAAVSAPRLDYVVNFTHTAPTTYYVWARGYAGDSESNGINFGIDGEVAPKADKFKWTTYDSWIWTNNTEDGPAYILPSSGVHTLNLWMWDDGVKLDRIWLTTDPMATPPADPTESLGCAFTPTPTQCPYQPDLLNYNQIVIEGEHYDRSTTIAGGSGHYWDPRNSPTHMRAMPNIGTNVPSNEAANSPGMHYYVNFASAGIYYIWVRGYADDSPDDQIHVGLNGIEYLESEKISLVWTDAWRWSRTKSGGAAAYLNVANPGPATINVWMCKDGFKLDRLVLTQNSSSSASSSWSGTVPPESLRCGGGSIAQFVKPPVGSPTPTPTSTPDLSVTPTPTATRKQGTLEVVAVPNLSHNGEPVVFKYSLGTSSRVKLMLFALSGEGVLSKDLPGEVGLNEWSWDLRNGTGSKVASGLYVYALQVVQGSERVVRKGKVVILR